MTAMIPTLIFLFFLRTMDDTGIEKVTIKERILGIASEVEELNDHRVYLSAHSF